MSVAPAITSNYDDPSYQSRVYAWVVACFGEEVAFDRQERNHRFLEEALELTQACGCTHHEAMQLVDYVFGRPKGEPRQEVGGVTVTLAALCEAHGIDLAGAAEEELARVWTKVETIRAKHAAKPKHSPLPGGAPAANDVPYNMEMVSCAIASTRFRVQCRIDGCLEEAGGDHNSAVTGVGIGVSYLLGLSIVHVFDMALAEIARLRRVIERDRSRVAMIYGNLTQVMNGRRWLTLGRGSYEWDDDRYKDEFRDALDALKSAAQPLCQLAGDLSDSPTDSSEVKLARAAG